MKELRLTAGFVALIVLAPFLPILLRGDVLTLRDHIDYFIPLRFFTAEVLRSGSLPLWNPYNGSGEPWLANPQTAVFYPPAWIFLLLPFEFAYVLFLAAHVALLAVGCLYLFRGWSGPWAAAFGAISAGLAGSTLSLLDIGNNLASLAWVPWVFAVALRSSRPNVRLLPASLLTLCFLGGEPLLALFAAVGFTLVRVVRFRSKALVPSLLTAAWTIGLSAVQLFPFLEFLAGTDRASGLDPKLAFSHSASLRDWSSVAVSPWAFAHGGLLPLSQSYIPSAYAGVPLVMTAVVAALSLGHFRRADRKAATACAWLLGVLAIAVAASSIPSFESVAALFVRLHMNVSRYPARLMPLGVLAIAGLGALGIDRMPRVPAPYRAGAAAVLLALLAVFGAQAHLPPVPSWRPILGFVLIGCWIAVTFFVPSLFARRWGLLAVAVVQAVDLGAAGARLLESGPFVRRSAPYADAIASDRKLVRLPGRTPFDRVAWLAGYRNLLDHKFDVSSPAPAIPDAYLELHDAAVYGPRFDLLRFLSVEYVISDRPLELPLIGHAGPVTLRRLSHALPFAVAWTRVETAGSENEAMRRLMRPGPIHRPIISGPDVSLITASRDEGAMMLEPDLASDRVAVEVDSAADVIVTLNQRDGPGWSVSIDGRPAQRLRANGIFRAVAVPAGRHRIMWKYRPLSLIAGAMITFSTMLFLLARFAHQIRAGRSEKILLAIA